MTDNRRQISDMSLRIGVLFLLFLLIGCKEKDVFRSIRNDDYSMVAQGTYHGHAVFLRDAGEYEDLVEQLRSQIEENIDVLPLITRKFFSVSHELQYTFKLLLLDRDENYLILRYFARIPEHPLYAGYQIQFVCDVESKRLIKIYTAEVPLE